MDTSGLETYGKMEVDTSDPPPRFSIGSNNTANPAMTPDSLPQIKMIRAIDAIGAAVVPALHAADPD
jgi:hypothetical protein